MIFANSEDLFPGVLVIVVPHMDDCILAMGGTVAQLPNKGRVHFIYATDGTGSPTPIIPWKDRISPDLSLIRMQEAKNALSSMGIPENNISFLGLPDGRLVEHIDNLRELLIEAILQIRPDHLLIPFRYDRHPDHLAINQVLTTAWRQKQFMAELYEYFVYYRWRLLPSQDVRKYIRPKLLLQVDIKDAAAEKRAALEHFNSQTTIIYAWQTRPNLTSQLLDDVSKSAEVFLKYDPTLPGATIFTRSVLRILIVHRLEPYVKEKKDWLVNVWRRRLHRQEYGTQ